MCGKVLVLVSIHPVIFFKRIFFFSGLDVKELPLAKEEARRPLESSHLSLLLL